MTVTLSEAGVCLILLEQELRNNMDEVARWERRLSSMRVELGEAVRRRDATKAKIKAIKEAIK